MSTNWEDEVNRYRKGSAIKRMSVVQTAPSTRLQRTAFQPTQTFAKIEDEEEDDDDDDMDDDDSTTLTATLSSSNISSQSYVAPSQQSNIIDVEPPAPVAVEIDPDEQWVELCATTDVHYRLFYNKHTKETTFIRPACLDEERTHLTDLLDFTYPQDCAPIEKMRFHIDKITRHIESSIQICSTHNITDVSTQDALKTLKVAVNQVSSTLQSTPEPDMQASILDTLIGYDQFTWDFSQSQAPMAYYRASTVRTDHAALAYKEWHMPQYFSSQPLLPGTTRVRLQISLPQHELQDSGAKSAFHSKRTLIEVKINEPVSSVLQKAYMKLFRTTPTLEMTQVYVIKALGYNEYFDHDQEIGSYAYIRKCLRDLQDPEVLLCKKPEVTANGNITPKRLEDALFFKDQYQTKIDDKIELLDKQTYADLIDIHSYPHEELIKLTSYPQNSIQVPFHVQVVGVENITADTCPRISQYADITGLYIKAVLFHGVTELPWQYETMSSVDISETIKFNETLHGNSQSLIANLPRETRIGFVLMARRSQVGEIVSPINPKPAGAPQIDEEKIEEKGRKGDVPLAWVVNNIINYQGEMLTGSVQHCLWPLPKDATHKKAASQRKRDVDPQWLARSTTMDNYTNTHPSAVRLYIKYPSFQLPVVAPLVPLYIEPNIRIVGSELSRALDKHNSAILLRVIQSDPLYELTHEIKTLLWNSRHYLIDVPNALPKVIQCADWTKVDMRNEIYRLLSLWSVPTTAIDAIELLDVKYADYQVRDHAVNVLRLLDDEDLQLYLLQLVQCIKYEPYHDSPLSRFLIERAISSPYLIGHSLFWHLKAEVHDPQYCERFTCIMEELLSHIGIMIDELYKQVVLVHKLQQVADQIIRFKREYEYSDEDTTIKYHELLRTINNELLSKWERFQIPLNPRWEAKSLIIEKCRFMSSKMVPLWLVFENADPEGAPIYLIFKSGDDLRQDLLTLQILRVMDRLWLQHGLDMRLKPYGVIATGVNEHGEGVGMIEVVLNSDTTSSIQVKYGGGARGALKLEPIDNFIREHNPQHEQLINSQIESVLGNAAVGGGGAGSVGAAGTTPDEPKKHISKYAAAVDNFVRSCAGYCVATFVLGIGDRHNGNIMVTKSGHLFHIDFGHFLGNFKKKFGVNRERAAFVFTPEMAYVMGGKDYKNSDIFKQFKNISSKSFRILREYAGLIESLFELMVVAGMPELSSSTSITYLRDKLYLDVDAKQAQKELMDELKKSLDSTYRRLDNMIHNLKHG
jgi:phosphatidylinositol-4,5-bisphosphate 3-kinase